MGGRASIAALLAAATLMQPAASARAAGVVDLPVSFAVQNTNTSAVPCPSDGRAYTVRGHLTAPASAFAAPGAVAVYLTGLETGEWNWRLTAVPGYDWPVEMARAGETSLTLDLLGYGQSGHPPGYASCYGSQADVVHQVVADLRAGRYRAPTATPPRFDRVVLVGHDVGGAFAAIATDRLRVRDIHVPVLLAIGADDKIFTQDGWAQQRELYAGSRDVTALSLAATGHYPMLERAAPRFRALVAGWLDRSGFGASR